jgi:hypothetical protein
MSNRRSFEAGSTARTAGFEEYPVMLQDYSHFLSFRTSSFRMALPQLFDIKALAFEWSYGTPIAL